MGSIKAQRLAHKVSENIRRGRPFTYEKAMIEVGYTPSTAKASTRITRTKSYRTALISANAPLLEGLQEEINAIKNAMRAKDKNNEEYRVLAGSLDLLTKNYQLLSGGATERQVFVMPSEVLQRNAIDTTPTTEQIEAPQSQQDVNSINGSTKPPNKV